MKTKLIFLLLFFISSLFLFASCSGDSKDTCKTESENENESIYLPHSDYINSSDGFQQNGYVPLTDFSSGAIEITRIDASNPDRVYKKVSSKFALKDTATSSADLTGFLPPIGNQGEEGSCSAFSIGYYVQTYTEAKEPTVR